MNRRTVLGGVGALGLAGLAGCLGAAGLDEHRSKPASVDPTVLEETGYERTRVEELGIEEEINVWIYTEEVSVMNHLTMHEKGVNLGDFGDQRAAEFVVVTSPRVEILGRELNPLGDMSTRELVDLVEDNYDGLDSLTLESEGSVTILGESTTQSTFGAEADFEGETIDVNLHVSEAVATDDDLFVAIGVYPQQVRDQEEEHVLALMEGIVEDADS